MAEIVLAEVKVLDKGFIRLVEDMGGDRAVVQAARISYGNGLKTPEEDQKLISYLMKHHHGSPFEQAVFKFHVKCPILVMRQWIRHRMSSYNEISARYTEMPEEYYTPEKWRTQAKGVGANKQGSVEADLPHANLSDLAEAHSKDSHKLYQLMINMGVAKEMARMVLPVNWYTQFYWTLNVRALMHFIALRSEVHAQWEIQQYSNALFQIFKEKMPWTAEAFLKFGAPKPSPLDAEHYPGL